MPKIVVYVTFNLQLHICMVHRCDPCASLLSPFFHSFCPSLATSLPHAPSGALALLSFFEQRQQLVSLCEDLEEVDHERHIVMPPPHVLEPPLVFGRIREETENRFICGRTGQQRASVTYPGRIMKKRGGSSPAAVSHPPYI